ncbi:MAG: hypothetical protein DMF66_10325 [Acidobacteria bacterium]|nr:MAG: hypothetical protein DMF66_10325 [Acidobacteriota bacterium]
MPQRRATRDRAAFTKDPRGEFKHVPRKIIFVAFTLLAALALWLMPGATSARQASAGIFTRQVLQSRKADPEAREKIDEAFKAFEELLAVSKDADAMGSHWRVRQESWRNAQGAWEKSSATPPPPVKSLKRCAVPLGTARGMIERADNLFRQARDSSDTLRAAQLLGQHERLLKQAEGPLERAESCHRAVRNAYLKGRKADDRSHLKVSGRP